MWHYFLPRHKRSGMWGYFRRVCFAIVVWDMALLSGVWVSPDGRVRYAARGLRGDRNVSKSWGVIWAQAGTRKATRPREKPTGPFWVGKETQKLTVNIPLYC